MLRQIKHIGHDCERTWSDVAPKSALTPLERSFRGETSLWQADRCSRRRIPSAVELCAKFGEGRSWSEQVHAPLNRNEGVLEPAPPRVDRTASGGRRSRERRVAYDCRRAETARADRSGKDVSEVHNADTVEGPRRHDQGRAGLLNVSYTLSRTMKWAAGSFIFCEAKLFRQINGFSEKLVASEEIDFSRRLKVAARKTGRKLVIIRDARLVTSARKLHLYKRREHARFLLRAVLFPRKVMQSREECHLWYDGRR